MLSLISNGLEVTSGFLLFLVRYFALGFGFFWGFVFWVCSFGFGVFCLFVFLDAF